MNKITLALAGLGFAAAAVPATAAPAWQNINQREANLYQRIDQASAPARSTATKPRGSRRSSAAW